MTVDPYGNRHPISPLIFGVNFGDPVRMSVVPYTLNRWGGNSTTRYNWKVDVNNTASDWFFMNVPHWPAAGDPAPYDPANLPGDSTADRFVLRSRAAGAQPLLTVPTIGYTPRSIGLTIGQARQKRWGASVSTYGTQEADECSVAAATSHGEIFDLAEESVLSLGGQRAKTALAQRVAGVGGRQLSAHGW